MRTLGALLAGGRSSRFGSDKAVALYRGQPLLVHALAAVAVESDAQLVVGRSVAGVACAVDWPGPDLGPLGGLAAALRYAAAHDFAQVLSVPVDCVGLPVDLLARLQPAPAVVEQQPVIGLWPVAALAEVEAVLTNGGSRSVRHFATRIGARAVTGISPIGNINATADLERLIALDRHPQTGAC